MEEVRKDGNFLLKILTSLARLEMTQETSSCTQTDDVEKREKTERQRHGVKKQGDRNTGSRGDRETQRQTSRQAAS